jgi:hypothetical protein
MSERDGDEGPVGEQDGEVIDNLFRRVFCHLQLEGFEFSAEGSRVSARVVVSCSGVGE